MLHRFFAAVVLCAAVGVAVPVRAAGDDRAAITAQIDQLLDAYAHKNTAAVMKLLDPQAALLMGADLHEVATTPGEIMTLLNNDFALWDQANFGKIEHMSLRTYGDVASAFFDVPFTAARGGGARSVVIRVATVWKKTGGTWRATQLLDTVPTVGQSAAELLKK